MIAVARGRAGRFYHGWYVVGACAVIACISWGLGFYGLGVYLTALRGQHGWSTGLISLAMTAYYLAGAAGVLVVGGLIDRHGPRGVLAYGAVAMAACIAAMAYLTATWQLFAVYLVMSTAYASLGMTAITATVMPWFRRQRGRAMTMALTGPSFGGIVVVPLFVAAVERWGFRTAAPLMATLLCSVILLLVAAVIRRRPEDLGLLPDGASRAGGADGGESAATETGERRWSRAAALRAPRFWLLALPFALAIMVQVGVIVHQLAFLEPRLGVAGAAAAVSITTLAALAGRVVMGVLADRMERRRFAAGCFAVQGAGLVLMAALDAPAALYLGSMALGLGVGVVITLPALLTGDEFGAASFGTVFAIVGAGMQLGVAAGPSLIGVARDLWGSYTAVLWLLVGIEAVAAALVLAGDRLPRPHPP